MPEMTSRAFSFNSPHGACTTCQGLGATYDFEPRLVVPDESKSLLEGAIAPWASGDRKLVKDAILALAKTSGLDPNVAVREAVEEAPRPRAVRHRRGEEGGQGGRRRPPAADGAR